MTSGLEKVIVRQMKCTSSGVGRKRPPEKGEGRGEQRKEEHGCKGGFGKQSKAG